MGRQPTGNPTGRPQKPIDWGQFEQLCALQCTSEEIGAFLGVHRETLYDRTKAQYGEDYSTIYKRFAESGKCSLRRNQFVLSKKNASMAIWLGKQWLGQKDMSKEETQDIVKDLIHAIRDCDPKMGGQINSSGTGNVEKPILETEQSILDKRSIRESDQIYYELGSKRAL